MTQNLSQRVKNLFRLVVCWGADHYGPQSDNDLEGHGLAWRVPAPDGRIFPVKPTRMSIGASGPHLTKIKAASGRLHSMDNNDASDMKLLPNAYARRKIAFVMLAVWLFAMASGVANACLLKTTEIGSHWAAPGSMETAHTSAALPGHASVAPYGADSDTSKAPCLKACDDRSQAMQKHHPGGDLNDPGLAPLRVIDWIASTPSASTPRRIAGHQPSLAEPPLRVRYSRWAS